MAAWTNLAGTVLGYLRLGLAGVRLKNSSGSLSVRNAADSADAVVLPESLGTGTRTGVKLLRDDGVWVVPPASSIANTPAGNIAATTVQAALNELDTEKAALAGSTAQGFSAKSLTMSGTNSTDSTLVNVISIMSSDTATLVGQSFSQTMTGGASTTSMRGLQQAITLNPAVQLASVYANLLSYTFNSSYSATSLFGSYNALNLGASAASATAITNVYGYFQQFLPDAAATSNITTYNGYYCSNIANGAAQTVTNARAFNGQMVAGTNRYNLYMAGTAINYLNGALLIGSTSDTGDKLQVTGSAAFTGEVKLAAGTVSAPSLARSGDLNTGLYFPATDEVALTAGGVQTIKAVASGATITGTLGVGVAPLAYMGTRTFQTLSGSTNQYGNSVNVTGGNDGTTALAGYDSYLSTTAATYTCANVIGFRARGLTVGSGSTVTYYTGVYVDAVSTATNNYGFRGLIAAAGTNWNLYMSGTAINYLNGALLIGSTTDDGVNKLQVTGSIKATTGIISTGATAGVGYGTGAGGTITQTSTRTTGVTLNKVSGAITLVSAAGSAAWQSFTVTNSAVTATDTISIGQKSGTDLYLIHVTAIAAGSFQITYATTGGTTTEQPVFNFNVIKGVSA